MLVLLLETAKPKATVAKSVTHSPPPRVNPMAWSVMPSLREKIAELETGLSVGDRDGNSEGATEGSKEGERDGKREGGADRDGDADGAAVQLVAFVVLGGELRFILPNEKSLSSGRFTSPRES
jgi:hypothetical protein